jgi:hypothetical protein
MAGLSTVSTFVFMPSYPLRFLAVSALAVVAIWPLCSQVGGERV